MSQISLSALDLSPRVPSRLAELSSRILCASCFCYFAHSAWTAFLADGNLPVLLLLISETLNVLLVITARFAKRVDRSIYASTITVAASFYFVFVDLSGGARILFLQITVGLQLFGICLHIIAKCYLGRSFGLLPANRGIVTSGPYSFVRHPIYLGYFFNHLGFLLAAWSFYNLGVLAILYCVQFLRIREEEKVLTLDAKYRDYARSVRYRVIPLVF